MLAAGVVYLLFRDRSRSSSSAPALPAPALEPLPGGGGCMPAVRTGGSDPDVWYLTRWAATVDDLIRRGVEPGPAAIGARALVAQWAHETDAGRSEYNFNLGGWIAAPGEACHELRDATSGAPGRWASFASLEQSIHEHIDRLATRSRFQPAFLAWIKEPLSERWIRALGAAGYYTADPDVYARAWRARLERATELTRAAA